MDKKIIKTDMQPASAKLVIVQGIVQNLPEIIGAIKEIYIINKKEQMFRYMNNGSYISDVTHWMPLPEPPEDI